MSILPTPSWICRTCVRGMSGQQRRGLRVRPRARQTEGEAARLPPADSITLTDGTTVRVQADRPQRAAVAPAIESPSQPPETTIPPPQTVIPPPDRPPHDDELIPSTPSAALQSYPKSKNKTPPETPPTGPHDYNWYFETAAPTPANKTHATTFFDTHGKAATLLRSIAHFRKLPETHVPEVAFIGRSNVGKSSLLNAVMGCDTRSLLARTSRTPGFTKTMNLYGIGPDPGVRIRTTKTTPTTTTTTAAATATAHDLITGPAGLTIVDMPGYGAGSLTAWGTEIMKYIQSRKALRRVFVLLDAEHGVKDRDRSVLASLRLAGVSHQVILSKLDKVYIPPAKEVKRVGKSVKVKRRGSVGAVRDRMREVLGDVRPPVGGGALGEILACSSEVVVDGQRLGVADVRFAVLKAVGLEGSERKGFTESKKKMRRAVELERG